MKLFPALVIALWSFPAWGTQDPELCFEECDEHSSKAFDRCESIDAPIQACAAGALALRRTCKDRCLEDHGPGGPIEPGPVEPPEEEGPDPLEICQESCEATARPMVASCIRLAERTCKASGDAYVDRCESACELVPFPAAKAREPDIFCEFDCDIRAKSSYELCVEENGDQRTCLEDVSALQLECLKRC